MSQEQFNFQVGAETLSGLRVLNEDTPQATLLFLHGGGTKSTKENFLWLAEDLVGQGIGSVLFDFSGHGQSTGNLQSSSLAKRTHEAHQAAQLLHQPIAVLGSSMGGCIAIKLTEHVLTHTLILFNPAIYASKAFNASFTEDFTNIIRKPYSWRDSDALQTLTDFSGNLLIVIGEDDEVIPPEVITLLDTHSPNAKHKEVIRIPNCTHDVHRCFSENPSAKERVINTIASMIKEEDHPR